MDTTAPHLAPPPAPVRPQPGLVRAAALFISYICHPVLMPTVMSLVLYKLMPAPFASMTTQTLKFRLVNIVLVTFFFPLLSVLLMKALGFVESIHLRTARDRIIPLIATMTFYFWAYQVFSHFPETPLIIRALLLGSFWGIIVLFIGSIFLKISMHTTAAGGMIGIMIMLLFISPVNLMPALLISIAIAGIIGTARLILREHTQAEIWIGYAIGLLVQLGAWAYVQ